MSGPNGQSCKTCRFWVKQSSEDEEEWFGEWGFCRRYPPALKANPGPISNEDVCCNAEYPDLGCDEWCGEWRRSVCAESASSIATTTEDVSSISVSAVLPHNVAKRLVRRGVLTIGEMIEVFGGSWGQMHDKARAFSMSAAKGDVVFVGPCLMGIRSFGERTASKVAKCLSDAGMNPKTAHRVVYGVDQ